MHVWWAFSGAGYGVTACCESNSRRVRASGCVTSGSLFSISPEMSIPGDFAPVPSLRSDVMHRHVCQSFYRARFRNVRRRFIPYACALAFFPPRGNGNACRRSPGRVFENSALKTEPHRVCRRILKSTVLRRCKQPIAIASLRRR